MIFSQNRFPFCAAIGPLAIISAQKGNRFHRKPLLIQRRTNLKLGLIALFPLFRQSLNHILLIW